MTTENQADLRAFALSHMRDDIRRVDIDDGNGGTVTFGIRQPTLAERNKVMANADKVGQQAKKKGASDTIADVETTTRLQVDCVILLVVDPETGDQLFSAGDFSAIQDAACGGPMAELMKEALKGLGVTEAEGND